MSSPRGRKRGYEIPEYSNPNSFAASRTTIDLLSDSEDSDGGTRARSTEYKKSRTCIELIDDNDTTNNDDRKPAAAMTAEAASLGRYPNHSSSSSSKTQHIIELIDDNDEHTRKNPTTLKKREQEMIELIDDNNVHRKPREAMTSATAETTNDRQDSVYAEKLQRQYHARRFLAFQSDEALAYKLQKQEEEQHVQAAKAKSCHQESDQALAKFLQQDEENKRPKRADRRTEWLKMKETMLGKSILLVERIIETIRSFSTSNEILNAKMDIKPVAKDDMVFLMERMLKTQATYKSLGYSSHVDTGFHYTSEGNMAHIRTNGLMSKSERSSQQITAGSHGSVYGDGIYTGNNPICFQNYGERGLVVARLKGVSVRVARFPIPFVKGEDVQNATTIVGNKSTAGKEWPESDHSDEIVLKSSHQCVPLIQYNRTINAQTRNDCNHCKLILHLQTVMQSMLNEYLNDFGTVSTELTCGDDRIPVAISFPSGQSTRPSRQPLFTYQNALNRLPNGPPPGVPIAPPKIPTTTMVTRKLVPSNIQSRQRSSHTPNGNINERLTYTAPKSLDAGVSKDAVIVPMSARNISVQDACLICQNQLVAQSCARLSVCEHIFHTECIKKALRFKPSCPICRKTVGDKPRGKSPSGTMSISISSSNCTGYEGSGSIIIDYFLNNGIQTSYHDNPMKTFTGKSARAYLPNTEEGRNLLKRLKFAFMYGLSFSWYICIHWTNEYMHMGEYSP